MKKALAICLAFCIVLSALIPIGIVAKAETEMTQAETILEEDFEGASLADSVYDEDGNYNTNNDIGGYNSWTDGTAHKNPAKPYDTNRVVNVAKIVNDDGNKAGSFTYTKAGSASNDNLQYYIKKETKKTVSTGKVIFKMNAKPTEQAGMLLVNLSGAAAQAAPYITFWFDNKRMAGDIVSSAVNSVSTMQAGVWTDYEIHMDFDSGKASVYAGGQEIKNTKTSLPSTLTQISAVSVGLHRTQGAWAADNGWLIDNIEVIAVPTPDARIAPTDEALTNKAKLTFNNVPVSVSPENVSIKAESGLVKASSVEAVEGDDKSFIVTFPKNLTPQTDYTVILNGITDSYGGTMSNKQITYTTPVTGNVYYVSPDGNDKNAGTEDAPWKTAYHAAEKLQAGDTAIFEDGIYKESNYTIVQNTGTEGKPITFKARNPHKAIIYYSENCRTSQKFRIAEKSYINVRDLYFTQESTSLDVEGVTPETASTSDIFINVSKSSYCEVTGNKIVKAFEEGIKGYCSNYITIANNEIYDMNHEGLDLFAVINPDVCGNKVINFGRDAFMIKGNSANCRVYNNYVHNDKVITDGRAFDIGGASDGTSPISTMENIGFENHNSVYYNNIVYAVAIDGTASIGAGFGFLGAENCHCYNNTIVGTTYGVRFQVPSDTEWQWFPNSINPTIKNNIMANVKMTYLDNSGDEKPNPENVVRDYNLFYNCGENSEYPTADEANSVVLSGTEDLFVAYGADWRIRPDSAAVSAGTQIADTYPGFIGYAEEERTNLKGNYYFDFEYDPNRVINVNIDLIDYDGNEREAWDIGAYSVGNCVKDVYVSQNADASSLMPSGYTWPAVLTANIGEQLVAGTDSEGNSVTCRVHVGANSVYVAENIAYSEAYDTVVLGDEPDGTTTLSLKMTDESTKEFTVKYNLDATTSGVYTVNGAIDGFSQTVPVIVTVCAKEENKVFDTHQNARVILDDGTWVDTSKLGCQYHDVAISESLMHYEVYVGEFSEKFTCGMDYPEGTLAGNQGSADEGDYYLSINSKFADNESVKIVNDEENSVLSIGPEEVNYGVKAVFNNTSSATTQKTSMRIKFTNLTEYIATSGTVNSIPYHVGIRGADGDFLTELYFRLYFNTNGFDRIVVGPHLRGGTYPHKEAVLNKEDGSSIVTFTETETESETPVRVGETDWITLTVIENADQTYNVYVNDEMLISAQTFYLDSNNTAMSGLPISQIDFRKRLATTESGNLKNDPTACMYVDDIKLYEYSRIAENLKASPDVAIAMGSDTTSAPIYLKMSDGSVKTFNTEFSAVDTSAAKAEIANGRIDGVNIPLDLSVVVCNYSVDGISLTDANGNAVAVPSEGKITATAQIRKMTDKGNATAIFAVYDSENVMYDCKTVSLADISSAEESEISATLNIPENYAGENGYIAVYIWEFDKIQPIDIANIFRF